MANLTKVRTDKDYEYYSRNPPFEKHITVEIPYEDITKQLIAKFASKISGYSEDYIIVQIWEHNEIHWRLIHNWLSPEQAQSIRDHKESWEN
jgi:hypothetical protein